MKFLAPLAIIVAVLAGSILWDRTPRRADLVIANDEVFTLDPQRMSYMADFRLAYALYEGLVRWNNEDLSIQPAAADLPDISEDGLTYTFRIRPDAQWSNGDPVTAHDFVYSWQRLLFPDTAADYSNLFFIVEGAEEFFNWRNRQLADFTARAAESQDVEHLLASALERFNDTVGIKSLDDRTLQIRLKRPTAYLLDLLCFAVCCPVHRPTVEGWPEEIAESFAMRERGWIGVDPPPWNQRRSIRINRATGRLEQGHEWARPGRLVSNGPYVLTEWRYRRDMRLERNPRFHSPRIMRNHSVQMISIGDANTAVLAFESGKIDWLGDVGVEYQADMLQQRTRYEEHHHDQINRLMQEGRSVDQALAQLPLPQRDERRNIHARPTFGTDFYSFNCRPMLADGRPNPFADSRVRRAFALAIDKSAIVQRATRLNEPVLNTLIPPGSIPGYRSPSGLSFDPVRARAELCALGWRDRDSDGLIDDSHGVPFPVIDLLWTTNSARYKWMSLELKSQWERELGVRVELRGTDTKFYKEDLKLGKFMIARGRWYGDYGDPTTFLDINRTGDGNNDRAFSSRDFDAMLDAAAAERDSEKRMRMLEDAERLLFEDQVPLLPICQLAQLYMYEPGRVSGLTTHPRLIQYFWQIEVN